MSTARVCAVQLTVLDDVEANLAACLRMLDEAAATKPDIVVLPEFCNHASWYHDSEHCYSVAVEPKGPFLDAIAAKAAEHRMWVVVNVTTRRAGSAVTGTNFLFDAGGALAAESDKQVLMGNENRFLTRADALGPIVDTPWGPVGMYSCMDGVIFETPRGLALRGARLLLNSLNSFAVDESSLHIPVRAPENRVFVTAANKVGPLIPAEQLAVAADRMHIDPQRLHGGGESQIVGPDGTILAIGPRDREAVVVADIDLDLAENKRRADGTDVFAMRRPELYTPLAEQPRGRSHPAGVAELPACLALPADDVESVRSIVSDAVTAGAALVVLPELAGVPGGLVSDPQNAAGRGEDVIAAITSAAGEALVVTSIVEETPNGYAHTGVAISGVGVVAQQRQLHPVARHAGWATVLGDRIDVHTAPWGRLAVIVGDDAILPETFRLAAIEDADVVANPTTILEGWEITTGLLERAAENRVEVLAASRPTDAGTGIAATLPADFTLWTKWTRPFDGRMNFPEVTPGPQRPGSVPVMVHPERASNRMLTHATDVVDSRPWWLLSPILSRTAPTPRPAAAPPPPSPRTARSA